SIAKYARKVGCKSAMDNGELIAIHYNNLINGQLRSSVKLVDPQGLQLRHSAG
ncbi:hypothetical protein ACLOJK_005110, partial [Asimina triloba]